MSQAKFRIGQRIKTNTGIIGHIVMIMNPFSEDRKYYCSMYPGAQGGYVYVQVMDLICTGYDEKEKTFTTLQALNIYNEDEIKSYKGVVK